MIFTKKAINQSGIRLSFWNFGRILYALRSRAIPVKERGIFTTAFVKTQRESLVIWCISELSRSGVAVMEKIESPWDVMWEALDEFEEGFQMERGNQGEQLREDFN